MITIGSFFGGKSQAVLWWEAAWYAAHSHFISRKYFVGKDQNIMNSLALKYPSQVFSVRSVEGCQEDKWFSYQYFLASVIDRYHQDYLYNASYCPVMDVHQRHLLLSGSCNIGNSI